MPALNFKASAIQIPERDGPRSYDPFPPGEYEMMVVRSANKATKSGSGSYLELEMHCIAGPLAGRRHWERLNLNNPSHQTVKIAQEQLARLCVALGLDEVSDSEELHDRPFIAEMGIDKKDSSKNVIWDYRSAAAAPAPTPGRPAPPAPAPAAPKAASRPWG